MSFQKIKPTKPELDRLKDRRDFTKRGEDLLKLKREQLINRLKTIKEKYFSLRRDMKEKFLKDAQLLEKTYESIGKREFKRISNLNSVRMNLKLDIIYHHEMGIDVPKTELNFPPISLPPYSYTKTSLYVDILIKEIRETIRKLLKLAELDKILYQLAEDNKKIQRRIEALDDIIIPKLERKIEAIEEILGDETREEFIRMKKIKEKLEKNQRIQSDQEK